jgi:hypothetical protein
MILAKTGSIRGSPSKRASKSLPQVCVVFVTVIVASCPLKHNRGQDIRATLERAEELTKSEEAEESIRLYRQILQSEPRCWQPAGTSPHEIPAMLSIADEFNCKAA